MEKIKKNKIVMIIAIFAVFFCAVFIYLSIRTKEKEKFPVQFEFKNISDSLLSSFSPAQIYILPFKNHDVVYVKCVFKNAGVLHDDAEKRGIAEIVSSLLFKKAEGLSAEETIEKITQVGIRGLSVDSSEDDFKISFYTIKKNAKGAIEFLNQIFNAFYFSDGDLEIAKAKAPEILDAETSPAKQLIKQKLYEILYGDCNYGKNFSGISQSIAAVTKNDVKSFKNQKLNRKNLQIFFAGDLSEEDAKSYAKILLNGIQNGDINQRKQLSKPNSVSQSAPSVVIKKNMNDIVCIAHGIRIDNENLTDIEKAALRIVCYSLFQDKYSYFVLGLDKEGIACCFSAEYVQKSYSNTIFLFAFVDEKDVDNYLHYFNEQIEKLNSGDIGEIKNFNFQKIKEYFVKSFDTGFYTLDDIDEQIKNRYLPFDKVTEKTIEKIVRKFFKREVIRSVICAKPAVFHSLKRIY